MVSLGEVDLDGLPPPLFFLLFLLLRSHTLLDLLVVVPRRLLLSGLGLLDVFRLVGRSVEKASLRHHIVRSNVGVLGCALAESFLAKDLVEVESNLAHLDVLASELLSLTLAILLLLEAELTLECLLRKLFLLVLVPLGRFRRWTLRPAKSLTLALTLARRRRRCLSPSLFEAPQTHLLHRRRARRHHGFLELDPDGKRRIGSSFGVAESERHASGDGVGEFRLRSRDGGYGTTTVGDDGRLIKTIDELMEVLLVDLLTRRERGQPSNEVKGRG
jgi:hypothetical protein